MCDASTTRTYIEIFWMQVDCARRRKPPDVCSARAGFAWRILFVVFESQHKSERLSQILPKRCFACALRYALAASVFALTVDVRVFDGARARFWFVLARADSRLRQCARQHTMLSCIRVYCGGSFEMQLYLEMFRLSCVFFSTKWNTLVFYSLKWLDIKDLK